MGRLIEGAFEAAPGELLTPSLSVLSLPVSFSLRVSSVTHLVRVDGHAGGEPHHGDAVEACSVWDGRWSEVVIGLWRVTHQDSVDLQWHRRTALSHSCTCNGSKWKRCCSLPDKDLHLVSVVHLNLSFFNVVSSFVQIIIKTHTYGELQNATLGVGCRLISPHLEFESAFMCLWCKPVMIVTVRRLFSVDVTTKCCCCQTQNPWAWCLFHLKLTNWMYALHLLR